MEINFKNYIQSEKKIASYQKLFYNMSKTMKYIHSCNYIIRSFNPEDIKINNVEKLSPIQFDELEKNLYDSEELINNNIHNLAVLQVATNTGLLPYMNLDNQKYTNYLKENFGEYESLLPEEDVRYFEGVIKRGSFVYYSDFINRRNELEVEKMEQDLGDSGVSKGFQKVKATAAGMTYNDADNETIKLYDKLNDRQQAAFTSFLILPIAMILLGIILSILIIIF